MLLIIYMENVPADGSEIGFVCSEMDIVAAATATMGTSWPLGQTLKRKTQPSPLLLTGSRVYLPIINRPLPTFLNTPLFF